MLEKGYSFLHFKISDTMDCVILKLFLFFLKRYAGGVGDSSLVLKQQGAGRSFQRHEGVCARGRGRGLCAETGSLVCTGIQLGVHSFVYNPTQLL